MRSHIRRKTADRNKSTNDMPEVMCDVAKLHLDDTKVFGLNRQKEPPMFVNERGRQLKDCPVRLKSKISMQKKGYRIVANSNHDDSH